MRESPSERIRVKRGQDAGGHCAARPTHTSTQFPITRSTREHPDLPTPCLSSTRPLDAPRPTIPSTHLELRCLAGPEAAHKLQGSKEPVLIGGRCKVDVHSDLHSIREEGGEGDDKGKEREGGREEERDGRRERLMEGQRDGGREGKREGDEQKESAPGIDRAIERKTRSSFTLYHSLPLVISFFSSLPPLLSPPSPSPGW